MPRSRELQFLKEKLQLAPQDSTEARDLQRRISSLQEAVGEYRQGRSRSPYDFRAPRQGKYQSWK